MPNIELKEKPVLNTEMEAMERTTPAHYEEWNRRHKQLLENDLYLKQQIENIGNTTQNIFSEDMAYEPGDYCIYDNVLYIFIAIKESGPWDPDAVQSTSIFGVIGALREIVLDLVDRMGGLSFRAMSQTDYNALSNKVKNRIYFAFKDESVSAVDTPTQLLPSLGNVAVAVSPSEDKENEGEVME